MAVESGDDYSSDKNLHYIEFRLTFANPQIEGAKKWIGSKTGELNGNSYRFSKMRFNKFSTRCDRNRFASCDNGHLRFVKLIYTERTDSFLPEPVRITKEQLDLALEYAFQERENTDQTQFLGNELHLCAVWKREETATSTPDVLDVSCTHIHRLYNLQPFTNGKLYLTTNDLTFYDQDSHVLYEPGDFDLDMFIHLTGSNEK